MVCPDSDLFVLSFPVAKEHFFSVMVLEAFPLAFEQVVPEAAPAKGAIATTAIDVVRPIVATATRTRIKRRMSFPFTLEFKRPQNGLA